MVSAVETSMSGDRNTHPVEAKSFVESESKSATQTNPEDMSAPAAVPVVTAEEAEKLNEDALAYALVGKEKSEPFYKFYQGNDLESVCFQGTIRATSTIPDPEKNDYDNCLYALFVEIDALLSDATMDTEIACEAIVNVPILKDKSLLQDNVFLPGDKIWCMGSRYDAMPQAIQEIQLSDDIQSYEHEQYYPFEIRKIPSFQKGGNRNFAKREITILPIQTLPGDESAVVLRKERIQNEIARIEEEIKKHGGSFGTWKEEYKSIAEKYNALSNEKFKGWINDSYFAAGGKETTYKTKEYIDGILPYKKYLENNNIDLIIVRIPSKWDFAARVLTSEDFQENPAWIEHYYECLKNDIEIVDPMPEMWEQRFDYPLFYYFHIQDETHPFLGTSIVLAETISNVLKRYSFRNDPALFHLEKMTFPLSSKYTYPEGNKRYPPSEPVFYYGVYQGSKSIGGLVPSSGSPFLFLSNSFFHHPARYSGGSVPGYSAYYLLTLTDWYYQQGLDNSMLRNLIGKPILLSNRNAVIMGEHPDHWKETPELPRYIVDNAEKISLEKTIDDQTLIKSLLNADEVILDKNDTGQTIIEFSKKVCFLLDVPVFNQKKTCMVRINFNNSTYATLSIKDSQNTTIIDKNKTSMENNISSDLFIPLSEKSNQTYILEIELALTLYNSLSIKNIELWYY